MGTMCLSDLGIIIIIIIIIIKKIIFSNIFPKIENFFQIMWLNMARPDRPQMTT